MGHVRWDTEKVIITDHFFANRIDATSVLSLTRTAARLGSREQLRATVDTLGSELLNIDRSTHGMLIDLRAQPEGDDADLDAAWREARDRLIEGFDRVAILTQRPEESVPPNARCFSSRGQALRWLKERHADEPPR